MFVKENSEVPFDAIGYLIVGMCSLSRMLTNFSCHICSSTIIVKLRSMPSAILNRDHCLFVMQLLISLQPLHAVACNISRLKDVQTHLQTVYFRSITHLLSVLCVLLKNLSHASVKKKTERLKGFRFRTINGRFQVTPRQ